MSSIYAMACTEALEIIKYFPKKDYEKISPTRIQFLEMNKDKDYKFSINPNEDLSSQNISRGANAILVSIYKEYFADEEQKEKIDEILKLNSKKAEAVKSEMYNPDNLFKKEETEKEIKEETPTQEALVEIEKENFFKRFIAFVKGLFSK